LSPLTPCSWSPLVTAAPRRPGSGRQLSRPPPSASPRGCLQGSTIRVQFKLSVLGPRPYVLGLTAARLQFVDVTSTSSCRQVSYTWSRSVGRVLLPVTPTAALLDERAVSLVESNLLCGFHTFQPQIRRRRHQNRPRFGRYPCQDVVGLLSVASPIKQIESMIARNLDGREPRTKPPRVHGVLRA
jgi:hypothetical protein